MEFENAYQHLNDQQRAAVDHIDGPLLVIAGPGTGKTQLLSVRVANILRQTDVGPENILCLTFTETGASNMRKRLVAIEHIVGVQYSNDIARCHLDSLVDGVVHAVIFLADPLEG